MLPFQPPVEPMLAKAAKKFPVGGEWLFEPKWDGFRALVFRDHDELYIQSREKKPLNRYFPELQAPLRAALPPVCVVDGELVVARNGALDFEALQMRIHPAESRVNKLAEETPASYVAFDLLALGTEDLRDTEQLGRRSQLEAALGTPAPPIYVTPATQDLETAKDWFQRFEGAGLDGVIAKPAAGLYLPKKRALTKLKHRRTAECVVAGFRWYKKGPGTLVGSLLLGLYDDDGKLHHVGITSSFTMQRRAELAEELAPLREKALQAHPWADWAKAEHERRKPGMTSRWNAGKDLSWVPLRAERVVEVLYDQLQSGRFRHATTFQRWRIDKSPEQCRFDQLETTPAYEVAAIFGSASTS